jgi:hypothetical protein
MTSFVEAAREFCRWAEADPSDATSELDTALRLLSGLYHQAALQPHDVAEAHPDLPEEAVPNEAIYKRFGALPVGYYAETLDPFAVPSGEVGVGDIADDLRDIYRDVKVGLLAHEAGRPTEALGHWAWTFRYHWGRHAAGALRALHWHSTR